FQATTGQMMARLEAEAANPMADVVISASMDTAVDFAERGMLLDHESPNAANVPGFLKGPNWVVQGISALAIAWNPQSGTPRPEDWADLAGPDYTDLVTMPDPSQSGSAYELVGCTHRERGDRLAPVRGPGRKPDDRPRCQCPGAQP